MRLSDGVHKVSVDHSFLCALLALVMREFCPGCASFSLSLGLKHIVFSLFRIGDCCLWM